MRFAVKTRVALVLALIVCSTVCRPWRLEAIDNIRIAYPSTSFTTMPILAASRFGLYEQEGLRPELIFMRPNISVTAVVTGQVEFATAHGSIVRAAAQGMPVKSLMVVADRPAYYLVARQGVNNVGALRGRSVGIASLGGSVHLMTKEFLAQNNLDADKNVALVVTGDHSTTIQAMQNGHVDAAVISVPWQTVTEKAGFRKLAYFGDVMRLPMAGLGASDENIGKKPDLLRRAVRATLRGIDFLKDAKNKREVVAIMVGWFKVNSEQAEQAYGQMVEAYPSNGMVADDVIEKDLEIARQTGAIKNRVPLSRVIDFQFVKAARGELSVKKP
ncbi:MAG TPA: ABC transporter substrate-binding protein [Phototrophicaceae bacterium]|nr:ABC transporter substrate-binding protein [Phototrophicaceae bacterium]